MIADSLRAIIPESPFLDFLSKRIELDNYRGNQISQHNRFDFDQVLTMLSLMNSLVGSDLMRIRTTDLSKRAYNTIEESNYAEYTRLVNSRFGKGTQDSIRKNLFVDFHRMGLIDRYDSNRIKIDPPEKKSVTYVSLTYLSLKLLVENSTQTMKYFIYNRALDNILRGLVSDLYDILIEIESDFIDIFEYTYILSFLYQDFYGKILYKEDIVNLLKEYRGFSKFQKHAITEKVREICNPSLFFGTKNEKRDFNNWINESQQVFSVLNQTTYYEYNPKNYRLYMMTIGDVNNEAESKLKRSKVEKERYFENHRAVKERGYELHHIIPLSWAKSREDFFLLDHWENMIYIDGYSHAQITQSGNNHVILNFHNNDIILMNHNLEKIYCYFNKNVIYSPENGDIMKFTNDRLLSIE